MEDAEVLKRSEAQKLNETNRIVLKSGPFERSLSCISHAGIGNIMNRVVANKASYVMLAYYSQTCKIMERQKVLIQTQT